MSLADQKCQACEGGVEPLTQEQAHNLGKQVPYWDIGDKHIERTFKFSNFAKAMDFANQITQIAEEEGHHPSLHIFWGKVRVELSTHSINGLSINDFVVAAKINKISGE